MVVVPVTMEMRDDNGNAAQLTGGWCANTLGSSDVAIEVPALMGVAPQCWSGHLVRRRRSGNHLCDNRLMNAPLPLLSRASNLFRLFAKRVQREYSNRVWFYIYPASVIHWGVDSTPCVVLQSCADG